ncbi:MAG: pilus assembly protein PilZ [bacterium]|nr:pilus assembly protein PilZ [bacterium]
MAQEKRRTERARRRLMVKFGQTKADKTGFTKNLSATGLSVKTNSVFKPGTTIQIVVDFQERAFTMWGRVCWAKKVPPQLSHVLDCGMGIQFVDPPEDFLEFFREWTAKKTVR